MAKQAMADLLNPLANRIRSQFENIEHVVPANVSYLTIFNPALSNDSESEADLVKLILCYVVGKNSKNHSESDNQPLEVDNNAKLRQIGLIQGITNFAKEFSEGGNKDIDYIDTEQTRIIIQKVEINYYIVACIELTKLMDNDNESDSDSGSMHKSFNSHIMTRTESINIEYSSANISPPSILCQDIMNAYNLFKLHHGSFSSLQEQHSITFVQNILELWWFKFIKNWDLSLNSKGYLKILNSYKLSSKSISYSNSSNIKNVNLITEKLSEFFQLNSSKLIDMIIYNPLDLSTLLKNGDSSNFPNEDAIIDNSGSKNSGAHKSRILIEEYGVIFKGFDIISNESLVDIYNWLENNNLVGIDSERLMMDNYPQGVKVDANKVSEANNVDADNSAIFNPFSSTLNKVVNFFAPLDALNFMVGNSADKTDADGDEHHVKNLNLMLKKMSTNKKQIRGQYLIGVNDKIPGASVGSTPTTSPNPDRILNSPWNNKDILLKTVYLKLSNRDPGSESISITTSNNPFERSAIDQEFLECNLVIYEIGGLLFVLIFESDYEDLNNMVFYEQLEENIIELFESINEYFHNNNNHNNNENNHQSVGMRKFENSKNKTTQNLKNDRDLRNYLSLKTLLLPFGMYFNSSETPDAITKRTDEYLRSHIEEDQQKLDKYKSTFYYIVFVPDLQFYQTSLPLIPSPEEVLFGKNNEIISLNQGGAGESGFLDPRYIFDLLVSRTQSLHLHNQLCQQFNFDNSLERQRAIEKMVSTDKFWWIYYSRSLSDTADDGSTSKKVTDFYGLDQNNYYRSNHHDREVFVLKKFSNLRRSKNLLFTDKSEDFLSMLGDNVKIWFDNCISTGRV